MNRERANDWLEQAGKHPSRVQPNIWRWTKPDPPPDRRPDELPSGTFDALRGPREFAWLFDTEEEAIAAAIEAIVRTFHACPMCDGRGGGVAHERYETDAGIAGRWVHRPCSQCNGIGHVSPDAMDRWRAGERLREDRKRRLMSLRDEAKRLGITPKELSDREWGRA